jgi:hypothetical protein
LAHVDVERKQQDLRSIHDRQARKETAPHTQHRAKAVRRAIANSDPSKEPPTVGKRVIIGAVAPAKAKLPGVKSRKSKDEVDR